MAVSAVNSNTNSTGNSVVKSPTSGTFKGYEKKFDDLGTTNAEISKMIEEATIGDKASPQSAQLVQQLNELRSQKVSLRSTTLKDEHDGRMVVIQNMKTNS